MRFKTSKNYSQKLWRMYVHNIMTFVMTQIYRAFVLAAVAKVKEVKRNDQRLIYSIFINTYTPSYFSFLKPKIFLVGFWGFGVLGFCGCQIGWHLYPVSVLNENPVYVRNPGPR